MSRPASRRRVAVPNGNTFLRHLTRSARERLGGEVVYLAVYDLVHRRGEVVKDLYFPNEGAISNVLTMQDGSQVEVGLVGREGMVGFPAVLTGNTTTNTYYAQLPGSALKVARTAVAGLFAADGKSMQPFLRYVDAQIGQLHQYSACNRLHSLSQRFARWLLMAHDRVDGDEIRLTQQFLALMLSVRRSGVSVAASAFQDAGLITYARGRIVVLERGSLQATACECYDAVEDRFEDRMGYSIRKHRARRSPGETVA